MVKERKMKGRIIRDEQGRIIKLENIPEEALLIPFIADMRRTIEKFDEDTLKYSKKMEKLTIAMLILAITQLLLAIVTVASTML